jgi:hypothetical protein
MASKPPLDTAQLQRLLAPVLRLSPGEARTRMGKTVGEGLVLPDAEALQRRALPHATVQRPMATVVDWLRTVCQPRWLPDPLSDHLFAVPRALDGEDACIGAWELRRRTLQAVVTRRRVHVLTRLQDRPPSRLDGRVVAAAADLAAELLRLPEKPDLATWIQRSFGGLLLVYRDVPFARSWPETLLVLTDGAGVKYSVLQYRDRTSEVERDSADPAPEPWLVPGESR